MRTASPSSATTTSATPFPGHVLSWEALVQDAHDLLLKAKQRFPNVPTYVFGHSMGGGLTTSLAIKHTKDVDGIVCADALTCTHIWPRWAGPIRPVLSVLASVIPKVQFHPIPASALSNNLEAVKAYEQDPLVHKVWLNFSSAHQFQSMSRFIDPNVGALRLPMFFLHGLRDIVVEPEQTKYIEAKCKSNPNFKARFMPGIKHEVYEDPNGAKYVDEIVTWFSTRVNEDAAKYHQ